MCFISDWGKTATLQEAAFSSAKDTLGYWLLELEDLASWFVGEIDMFQWADRHNLIKFEFKESVQRMFAINSYQVPVKDVVLYTVLLFVVVVVDYRFKGKGGWAGVKEENA